MKFRIVLTPDNKYVMEFKTLLTWHRSDIYYDTANEAIEIVTKIAQEYNKNNVIWKNY